MPILVVWSIIFTILWHRVPHLTLHYLVLTIILMFLCRYIRPQFFYNNPLLSFIQFVIGPYADDLGNVLPNAVEGVGVPVDPLAFAGFLGEYLGLFNHEIKNYLLFESKLHCKITMLEVSNGLLQ